MNLQENIRKVIREENSLLPMIRRRVPQDGLEREFKESLDMASKMLNKAYQTNGDVMSLDRFIDMTGSLLIDGIHYELYSTTPLDSEWYDDVIKSLKNYYRHRIIVRYSQITRKL
jgi:hypothetical protein